MTKIQTLAEIASMLGYKTFIDTSVDVKNTIISIQRNQIAQRANDIQETTHNFNVNKELRRLSWEEGHG